MSEETKKSDPEGTEKPIAPQADSPAESVENAALEGSKGEASEAEAAGSAAPERSDALDQASLLRRAESLGGDDDALEKVARAEEEKLRARTAGTKKKSSKLADDANRRLQKVGEKKKSARVSEVGAKLPARDRLTTSGDSFIEWVKKHQREVAIAIGGALLLGAGAVGYASYRAGQASKSGETLSKGILDARAPIVAEPEKDKRPGAKDRSFKSAEERRKAALAEFREVRTKYPSSGAAYLAELSEGALLLDERDVDGAINAFTHVAASPLGQVDVEVRGRALEGLGFAYELKGQKDPAALDEAAKRFKELEQTEVVGFKELGIYHQARVAESKGDKDKAKTLLKDLRDRLAKSDTRDNFRQYLSEAADDRLRALDPGAVPQRPGPGGMAGGIPGMGGPGGRGGQGGGGQQFDEAQLKKLLEQMKQQQAGGGGGHP